MDHFIDTPIEALENHFLANVINPLYLTRLALDPMIKQGGGIMISVTSGAGNHESAKDIGEGGWGLGYSISKASVNRMVAGPRQGVPQAQRGLYRPRTRLRHHRAHDPGHGRIRLRHSRASPPTSPALSSPTSASTPIRWSSRARRSTGRSSPRSTTSSTGAASPIPTAPARGGFPPHRSSKPRRRIHTGRAGRKRP